ncbi:MAG: hypothetical protein F8N39_01345 [Clostridiaceae bacterium]|nr:hypothetical protein [Clostridiaceae bacterium]
MVLLIKTQLGDFKNHDSRDIYYFDVSTPGQLNITINSLNSLGMNWMLYKETDLKNYVAYSQTSGSKLTGSYNAQPGRYYLYVYRYSGTTGSYNINIDGIK